MLTSAGAKDIFWDMSRRFVKYCEGCRSVGTFYALCLQARIQALKCPVDEPLGPIPTSHE